MGDTAMWAAESTRSSYLCWPVRDGRRFDHAVERRVCESRNVLTRGCELEDVLHETLLGERHAGRAEAVQVAAAVRRRLLPTCPRHAATLPHRAAWARLESASAEVALLGVLCRVVSA